MTGGLHADAVATLTSWRAPSPEQERLRELYLTVLAQRGDAMYRSSRPDHLTGSVLVFSADHRQVLLTLHAKAGLWLQTGGHCEPSDTTLAGAALREGVEESGIDDLAIDPVPVLLSRHAVPFCVPGGHHLDVQLVAVAPGGATAVRSEESADLRWFDVAHLPANTDDDVRHLVSAGARRLREDHVAAPPAEND
ncbi:NUDIX domain-containing protein [Aeromicrobium sp.]|uniref:NUDIX hydrolase n=1 Tax=Aeromicrobium sp. TaxID=1871063 RepID=UPI0025BC7D79|nr:NUDIX domain-containing protein [Aeromicrobium sp.]MCK5891774.1 NUDIX domain-containing protein [Aeromicrobium sp.]